MRSTIGAGTKGSVEFLYEFQETTRISTKKYEDAMVSYMKSKYQGEHFDLIVAMGAPSLRLVVDHESEIFPGVPRIFYFHDEREETVRGLWPRTTGVWANLEIAQTLGSALELQPETKNVLVISGNSSQDKFLKEQAQRELKKYEGKVTFTYLNDVSMDELSQDGVFAPEDHSALHSLLSDNQGNSFSGPVALVVRPLRMRRYMAYRKHTCVGIVGGSLIDFDGLGSGPVNLVCACWPVKSRRTSFLKPCRMS